VVATPGALYRYWRQGQTGGRLAVVLIAGTLVRVSVAQWHSGISGTVSSAAQCQSTVRNW
jgi:hypothetical protein